MKPILLFFTNLLFLPLLFGTGLQAQSKYFSSMEGRSLPKAVETVRNIKDFNVLKLDEASLRSYLLNAPIEFENNENLQLEIPMPNGKTEVFGLVESSILSPEIAAQHPEIKSYTGNGLKNKEAIIRLTFNSGGLHIVILNYDGDAVYFEHYSNDDKDVYYSYFTRNAITPPDFGGDRCGTTTILEKKNVNNSNESASNRNNTGSDLRTFRLAMAATGEFTASNGGTEASSFNKVIQYVATLNLVFRRELSVHFNLVSGTNLVYTDGNTDPYTNSNVGTMLGENQANVDAVIGNANYDIGFVLGDGGNNSGGGVASFSSLCNDSAKARGAGGEGGPPYSQVFGDQLVLHEVGHQFGMNHSYNSSIPVCTTRNASTSVEPGAGATIMSYGFTCGSDDYFNSTTNGPILNYHTASYFEADALITSVSSCAVSSATSNTPPVITMPTTVTIPKSTPFSLTASADTPGSGDSYTYCWEGTDVGAITPTTATLDDTSQPPFFRTYDATASAATRTFPILSAILDGTNQAKGDKLPSITTAVSLRMTVRDNNAAGGGLSYSDMIVNVDGSIGPFLETTNLSSSYTAGSVQTITWSVNGTDTTTPNVNILLSTDGGLTFPTLLATNTANDGTESIMLPNIQTTTARIKVEAVGNVFFDISNNNFAITIAGCTAISNNFCPTNAVTFPQGDAGLNLTLNSLFGTTVTQTALNINASSPSGELVSATTSGGTTCSTQWQVENYETFDFSVDTAGSYTIANVTSGTATAFSVFLASGYNPGAPCMGTFLKSNATGAISFNASLSVTLSECTTYKLIAWNLNANHGPRTMSFSGAGSVSTVAATPADSGYTYVAVNNANNQIGAQSAAADFTGLAVGSYKVYGASYKNGGAGSPANSNPTSWVGQTLTAVQTSECVVFSNSNKPVVVDSTLSIESVNETIKFKIYPNPASSSINVSGLTTKENYIIYNILGSKISNGEVSSSNNNIPVNGFSNGIYLLSFSNGTILKFVKE